MVQVVLLDADGVIQQAQGDFLARLSEVGGDDFTQDLFSSEQGAAVGEQRFREVLQEVMARWQVTQEIDTVLEIWRNIDVIDDLDQLTASLKAAGLRVCLATNQQDERRLYMSETLGYDQLFDESFYSCEVGFKKPSAAFFQHILEALGCEPQDCLFLDDSPRNVEGAKSVGMNAELFAFSSTETASAELQECLSAYIQIG